MDRFLAMKEKYEQVNATHTQYERELAQAAEKMRNLQNECNLLLDAVDIAVPGQPTLIHYLQHDPVPIHYTTASVPVAPEVIPVPIPVQVPMPMQVPIPQQPHPMPMIEPIQFIPHQPPNANGTNGHI
ncbi:hypothetical protein BC629DRAFT_1295726 [Irpex lacteus]|nr:hypothetical protein BC629DRAFT_1295726 [Irpex lacteus]